MAAAPRFLRCICTRLKAAFRSFAASARMRSEPMSAASGITVGTGPNPALIQTCLQLAASANLMGGCGFSALVDAEYFGAPTPSRFPRCLFCPHDFSRRVETETNAPPSAFCKMSSFVRPGLGQFVQRSHLANQFPYRSIFEISRHG